MNERSAFTARWLKTKGTISPASKPARKRRANCCSCRNGCAKNFQLKEKPPKRSRAPSMPIRKTFFTCYGTCRATMEGSKLQLPLKLRTTGFLLYNTHNCAVMADKFSEIRMDSLTVP